MNWALTSDVGGKTAIIPWRVSFQLHFTGKVIYVFWKLSLKGFTDISGNNMLAKAYPLISFFLKIFLWSQQKVVYLAEVFQSV